MDKSEKGTESREDNKEAKSEPTNADPKARRRRENAGEIDDIANNKKSNADGWMVFTPAEAKKVEETDEDRERAANLANKDKHFQESGGDDIMLIPDLEEDGDYDQRVAHAPRNVARKIPTLAELESDVKSSIPKDEGGLDLSALLSALVPQAQLIETDTTWTFDELLRDVTDELTGMQKIVLATITKELSSSKSTPAPTPAQVPIQVHKKVNIEKRKN